MSDPGVRPDGRGATEEGSRTDVGGDGPLSRVCALADWERPALTERMDRIAPVAADARVHRKRWEFALGVTALERAGALTDDALGLSVGAGHEPILYYLTTRCRWLLATDIYGVGDFSGGESSGMMLVDPDLFAPYPYRRRRLTVAYMDALDLRFEDEAFDFVVSFGSIEHFGGREAAAAALREMARVLRPGGLAFVTTELVVDGGGDASLPGLELFSAATLSELVADEPRLDWFGEVDLSARDEPGVPIVDLGDELGRIEAGDQTYPHVRLQVSTPAGPRRFASVSLSLRRTF